MTDPHGFNWGLPLAASTYAHHVDAELNFVHWAMVVMFTVGVMFWGYCILRFRGGEGRKASYRQKGELLSLSVPVGILVGELWMIFSVGIPMWTEIKQSTPPPEKSLNIQLVAQQFAWNFQYPGADGKLGARKASLVSAENPIGLDPTDPASKDDVISINQLHVPMGKPVILKMPSKAVIHNFAVAEFRNRHDVVPGLTTMYWFEPTREGKFEIGCSQLCGLGHTRMVGNVIVESPEAWDAWMKSQLPPGGVAANQPEPAAAAS